MERQTVVRSWTHRGPSVHRTDGRDMTQQSHAESADINSIVTRFQRTGALPPSDREGFFGDVTSLQCELTEAHNRSLEAVANAQAEYQAYVDAQESESQPAENAGASPDPEPTTE